MRRSTLLAGVLVAAATVSLPAAAQPSSAAGGFELGLRANVVGGSGKPANDMLGAGVYARWRLAERWRVGVALDHAPGFDVERPFERVGLESAAGDEEIDADATSTALVGWVERVFPRPGGRLELFWGAGAGVGSVEVDDLVGPRRGGGTYHLVQDVGTELIATASAGLRVRFARRLALEAAARLDQHFTDWQVTDRRSGRTAEYDDYLARSVHLGVAWGLQ
jgi:hypothetical protein